MQPMVVTIGSAKVIIISSRILEVFVSKKSFTDIVFQSKEHNSCKNYTPFQKAVAEAVAENEVSNSSYLAFKLSAAPTTKSGYSFGGNQLDLGIKINKKGEKVINTHAAATFLDIMKNAVDKNGNKIVTKSFLDKIATVRTVKNKEVLIGGAITKIGDTRTLTPQQEATINKAFTSDYGKKKITQDYMNEITKRIDKISKQIDDKIKSPKIRATLKREQSLILLVDYDNQFHLGSKGKMMKFLQESESNNNFNSEDIEKFVLENTTYGKKAPEDIKRRYRNAEKALKKFNVQISGKESDIADEMADIMMDKLKEKQKKCITPRKAVPPISLKTPSKTQESGRSM